MGGARSIRELFGALAGKGIQGFNVIEELLLKNSRIKSAASFIANRNLPEPAKALSSKNIFSFRRRLLAYQKWRLIEDLRQRNLLSKSKLRELSEILSKQAEHSKSSTIVQVTVFTVLIVAILHQALTWSFAQIKSQDEMIQLTIACIGLATAAGAIVLQLKTFFLLTIDYRYYSLVDFSQRIDEIAFELDLKSAPNEGLSSELQSLPENYQGIDLSQIYRNLEMPPEQRLIEHQNSLDLVSELEKAGLKLREKSQ